MGCSCRMFREEPLATHSVCQTEPPSSCPKPVHEGSRDPALTPSGGVLVLTRRSARPPTAGLYSYKARSHVRYRGHTRHHLLSPSFIPLPS